MARSDASLLRNLGLLQWHLIGGLALGRRWLTWLGVRILLSSDRLRIHHGLDRLLLHDGLTWMAWLLLWNLHVHLLAGLAWLLAHQGLALTSGHTGCMRTVNGLRDLSLLPSLLLDAADDTDDDKGRDYEADRS